MRFRILVFFSIVCLMSMCGNDPCSSLRADTEGNLPKSAVNPAVAKIEEDARKISEAEKSIGEIQSALDSFRAKDIFGEPITVKTAITKTQSPKASQLSSVPTTAKSDPEPTPVPPTPPPVIAPKAVITPSTLVAKIDQFIGMKSSAAIIPTGGSIKWRAYPEPSFVVDGINPNDGTSTFAFPANPPVTVVQEVIGVDANGKAVSDIAVVTILLDGIPPVPPGPPVPPTPDHKTAKNIQTIIWYDPATTTPAQAAIMRDPSVRTSVTTTTDEFYVLSVTDPQYTSLGYDTYVKSVGSLPAVTVNAVEGLSLDQFALPTDAKTLITKILTYKAK